MIALIYITLLCMVIAGLATIVAGFETGMSILAGTPRGRVFSENWIYMVKSFSPVIMWGLACVGIGYIISLNPLNITLG